MSEDFEKTAFWVCLRPWVRPLAFVVWRLNPDFFSSDLEFVRHIGSAANSLTIEAMANGLERSRKINSGLLRRVFYLRISGRRIMKL